MNWKTNQPSQIQLKKSQKKLYLMIDSIYNSARLQPVKTCQYTCSIERFFFSPLSRVCTRVDTCIDHNFFAAEVIHCNHKIFIIPLPHMYGSKSVELESRLNHIKSMIFLQQIVRFYTFHNEEEFASQRIKKGSLVN